MLRSLFAFLGLIAGSAAAPAATIDVVVRDAAGKPVANAAVLIEGLARPAGAAIRFAWPNVMAQQNIAFDPQVLIVPVGSSVSFPNRDRVRHHVYSFSKVKKFEIKLYGRDESRSMLFDRPGIVPLGCNIHDSMNGFIVVADTPFAARTDRNGRATIADTPAGAARLRIWHPHARVRGGEIVQPIALAAGGRIERSVSLDVRPPTATR